MKNNRIGRDFLLLTVGMLIASSAIYFFLIPGNLVIGSVAGLALVISQLIPLPISAITFVLNGGLLILGYLLVGKEFGAKTVYTSLLLPIFLFLFERLVPITESLMGDAWLDLLCFILTVGAAQAILFRQNASSGGLDVVAKILNKYFHLELGTAVTLAGMATSVSAIFVYDVRTVILGLLGTYLNGIALDHYISGFNTRKRVCIISDKYLLIQDYIVKQLERGATLYPIRGGYSSEEKIEIEAILTRTEFGQLMNYLNTVDVEAFITAGNVSEIYGKWNYKKREKNR